MKETNKDIRERVFRQLSRAARPLSADALAAALRLKKADKPRLLLALAQMEKSGKIQRNKKGKYLAGSGEKTVRARMLSLNRALASPAWRGGGRTALSRDATCWTRSRETRWLSAWARRTAGERRASWPP